MIQSKNLKLKLGLCGLALTSFLAFNSRSVVHADTVQDNANQNAITWDSDQDDSQVVHEDSQQVNASRNVQTQGAVQSVPATQSVQSNAQNRAETSAVLVSNFNTSTVNRNNVNNQRNNANVKVATVHDTAQMPVQKQKVAQFNQGSKIYTLNGSNQLSKNNGDGYVITNAGTYNGRAVDIGVTINGVQDNQGTYTTKWSNGDNADVTGKTDANFKYQDSVLLNQQQVAPQVDQTKTRPRTETQNVPQKLNGFWVMFEAQYNGYGNYQNVKEPNIIDPELVASAMTALKCDEQHAVYALIHDNIISNDKIGSYDSFVKQLQTKNNVYTATDGNRVSTKYAVSDKLFIGPGDGTQNYDLVNDPSRNLYVHYSLVGSPAQLTFDNFGSNIMQNGEGYSDIYSGTVSKNDKGKLVSGNDRANLQIYGNSQDPGGGNFFSPSSVGETKDQLNKLLSHISSNGYNFTISEPVQVTDHLQVDSSTPASLNYNYAVGLYDAQTGDLITDLKPEYKSKAGVAATTRDSVMNNAIKSKIQQIKQGKATVSYTGTRANDDVAFYQETRQVNPQDKNVNRQVQRVIHINFPNGKKPASYDSITDSKGNKLTLDSNNNLTQSMSFTRTGVQNIVSGHVTYGNWQQHGSINAVTLPSIPGYTMVTNN